MAASGNWYADNNQNTLSVLSKPTKFYEKLEKAQSWQKNKSIEGVVVRFTAENTCQIWSRVDNEWIQAKNLTPETAIASNFYIHSDERVK